MPAKEIAKLPKCISTPVIHLERLEATVGPKPHFSVFILEIRRSSMKYLRKSFPHLSRNASCITGILKRAESSTLDLSRHIYLTGN